MGRRSGLQPTTRYWWRARATQGGTAGPWSTAARFRSKVEGYLRAGELYDLLANGETVGAARGVTFVPGGIRFEALDSLITYLLPQTLTSGEFSAKVSGITTNSPGDRTKILSMQEGQSDITDNRFRATVEKRFSGEVSFRFISGDALNPVNADLRLSLVRSVDDLFLAVDVGKRSGGDAHRRKRPEWPGSVRSDQGLLGLVLPEPAFRICWRSGPARWRGRRESAGDDRP